eukprot:2153576-Pyramimonas_sp.AAC.1
MATSFVREYVIPTVDPVRSPQQAPLDICNDDCGLSSSGISISVVSSLKKASVDLLVVMETDMGAMASTDKAAVVSYHADVGQAINIFLGQHGGPSADARTSVNLGVDDGAGQARRIGGRGKKAKSRMQPFRIWRTRARKARQALGRHARN